MTEFALRVRFIEEQVLICGDKVSTPMTWTDREDAKEWAKENGIADKVYTVPMFMEEDFYSKTIQAKNIKSA